MNRLFFLLLFIPFLSQAQVRPDFAPLVESPDTSNFEVYGQKGGNLRRTTLDRLGGYLFENLAISYDASLGRIYLESYGAKYDSINVNQANVAASFADTILTINDTNLDLSALDNSFIWSPSTYTLILERAGVNDTISLSNLAKELSYDNTELSLIFGTDSVDVSQLRQTLSYDGGTNVLTLSNGGGSVTLSGSGGLTGVITASYFGGDGTSGDPLTIDDSGITFTKVQNINSQTILGRYSAGSGVIQQLTLGSAMTLSAAGVLNVNTDSVSGGGGSIATIDTTFSSDGTDITSAFFTGLLGTYDVINLDAVLQAAPSSGLIISLPSAATYEGKEIFISNVDLSSSDFTLVSGVANANFSSQYRMRNGEVLHLKAMSLDGTIYWAAIASSETYLRRYSAGAGTYVTADGLGITASKTAGTVTITIPNNVHISSFRFFGSSADLSMGEITFDIVGGHRSGNDYNSADSNMYYPVITMQQRTVAPGSDFEQRPYDAGGFQIFNEVFATSGTVSVKITGLSGSFGVFGQF